MKVIFSIFTSCLLSSPAFAALGDTITLSTGLNIAKVPACKKDCVSQRVKIGRFTVKHFIAKTSEKAFKVAWVSKGHPPLHQILGPYHEAYRALRAKVIQRGHHRSTTIVSDNLVCSMSGRMGIYTGACYDPTLVPPGVNAEKIQ